MSPYVNIHTHSCKHTDIEIQNIDVDNFVNVDVSHFYSMGIHPWNAEDPDCEKRFSSLENIITNKQILAVGECGIDRVCNSDFETQKYYFIKQIEISEQYQKPLIIHCVRAYPDIISIRKETRAKQPWIIHGFQGNEQSVEQLLRHENIYLSLGDVLLKNKCKAQRLLEIIPLDRLFLETDTADISIGCIYEIASVLSDIKSDVLRDNIFNNFGKIFGHI